MEASIEMPVRCPGESLKTLNLRIVQTEPNCPQIRAANMTGLIHTPSDAYN